MRFLGHIWLNYIDLVLSNLNTFEKAVILALIAYIWGQRGLLSEVAFVTLQSENNDHLLGQYLWAQSIIKITLFN